MRYRFFVVDDDRHYGRLLSYRLDKDRDHDVHVFTSGEDALDALDTHEPDLVLLDIMMPGIGGMETLRRLRLFRPELPVVMISAQGTAEVAVEAMKGGASDYITKGQDDLVKLDVVVRQAKERIRLRREVEQLRGEVARKFGLEEIVGDSPAMENLYRLVQKTLRGNLTVAILGESGTGKELVARAIHFNTARPAAEGPGPFVVVNCAAIPKELMESEFFGHEKGAFTGAHARHIGKFEQADGGTLFLDEVGELDLGLQAKLLRALQNREITRVGGSETIRFSCRIISATNRDPLQMVAEGTFREDLYYRLFQFPVHLPPLRARGQDVLLLAHTFLRQYAEQYPAFKNKRFSPQAAQALMAYPWPGNVRELKSVVERAILIADGEEITEADLLLTGAHAIAPWAERGKSAPPAGAAPAGAAPAGIPALPAVAQPAPSGDGMHAPVEAPPPAPAADDDEVLPLEELKRRAVERAFHRAGGNVERAAGDLGIGRATMYRLLKKYDLSTD
ncbi:MAG: sigma-54-dependent transcriptional regulator [Rubricoccaceae bacterium]